MVIEDQIFVDFVGFLSIIVMLFHYIHSVYGRYFLGTYPTACSWSTFDHLLIAMACGLCKFPVSRSQSRSPSASQRIIPL